MWISLSRMDLWMLLSAVKDMITGWSYRLLIFHLDITRTKVFGGSISNGFAGGPQEAFVSAGAINS
jgi:hypothetical protein